MCIHSVFSSEQSAAMLAQGDCARALLKEPWLRPSLRKMGQWEGLRLMLILGRGCRRCGALVFGFQPVTIDGSALGWSWEVTYNAATKEEAEATKRKQGTTYWWLPDCYSRTATAVLPTIHKEPRASEQVFQLRHPAFISWNDVRNSGGKALVFVDGTPWMVWLCGPWLTSWRRDLSRSSGRMETCSQDTLCHFAVCLQCHVGRHSALQWGVRVPHTRQSVFILGSG